MLRGTLLPSLFELTLFNYSYNADQSDAQRDSCSGILILAGCEARPRPSKKDGKCFKIFNLAQYPIYSKQGLKGETLRKALLPVGDDYCIMRVSDEKERMDWIDKIHQAIPDYERIKALGAGADVVDYDSDSDDEEDVYVPVCVSESGPGETLTRWFTKGMRRRARCPHPVQMLLQILPRRLPPRILVLPMPTAPSGSPFFFFFRPSFLSDPVVALQ
jgi:hypothetical protein